MLGFIEPKVFIAVRTFGLKNGKLVYMSNPERHIILSATKQGVT